MLVCALDTKEVDLGTEPQQEVVVGEGCHLRELHLAPGQVDAGNGGLVDGDVRLLVEQVAQGMADTRTVSSRSVATWYRSGWNVW